MQETTSNSFESPSILPVHTPQIRNRLSTVLPRRGLLVVEDDPSTRRALSRLFLRLGWEVYEAETVAEGMRLLDRRIEAAILDLNLPDGDGATILQAIRDLRLSLKVVIASATMDAEHLARVARMKPDLMLQKPIDYEPLLILLDRGTQSVAVSDDSFSSNLGMASES